LNRRVFTARIAEQTNHAASAIDAVLEAAVAVLAGELVKVGRFEWRGFGTFTVRTYPARKIHNPATGKNIALPARKSITYKPSQKIRARLKVALQSRPAERPGRGGAKKTKPGQKLRKGKPRAKGR
jgi:DNA-binding protein HU-beta